jgi:hypothetical protein
MDKVKLEFKAPETKEVEYNGVNIQVTPYLTSSQQVALINTYISTYFGENEEKFIQDSEYSYLEAEFELLNLILQLCTNVDIDSITEDMYTDLTLSGKVYGEIHNYGDFRAKLNYIINEVKQQENLRNSIGKVVSDLVEKAYDVLNKLTDITPEQIEKLQQTGVELAEAMKQNPLLDTADSEVK